MSGMFVAPFVAQTREVARWLTENKIDKWVASTTHAQQGSEADVVVFDTVHAGSTAWSHAEWQRLINVGMSRARHLLVVLASRLEMQEPFLRPLVRLLTPQVIRGVGGRLRWHSVAETPPDHTTSRQVRELDPASLGAQIESRKSLRPILGAEQQRLCLLPIDGKPRLVRGVAGSGKTAVLAHWLARRVAEDAGEGPFWVVYANQALKGLIQSQVESVWRSLDREDRFPWDSIEVLHVLELLERLEREHGVRPRYDQRFDFEVRSSRLLANEITPRCRAMFVDEAQDCGDSTLALLARLVEPTDPSQPGQRAINIFYDNAQNVYGRGTPKWVDLGLDMIGRSTVMKESYRATLPATEFALNTLYRLEPPDGDPDHGELVSRDLLHEEERNGRRWWRVRFNEVDGPLPDFRQFPDRDAELGALRDRVVRWIRDEGVRPTDVRVLANGQSVRRKIIESLTPAMQPLGVRIEGRTSANMADADDVLLVTTAHSFKGYDSEIVAVPAADRFVAGGRGNNEALSHPLYVAMTRARSVLYVSAMARASDAPSGHIVDTLQSVFEDQRSIPTTASSCTEAEENLELIERLGAEHKEWLRSLASSTELTTGPILRSDGSILANPLFHCQHSGGSIACFTEPQTPFVIQDLDDLGIRVIGPGESLLA